MQAQKMRDGWRVIIGPPNAAQSVIFFKFFEHLERANCEVGLSCFHLLGRGYTTFDWLQYMSRVRSWKQKNTSAAASS